MSKNTEDGKQGNQKYQPTIFNKKAKFDYHLLEKFEAGIVLVGTEVKSLRQGKASLDEAYARIRSGELCLVGCNIATYPYGGKMNHEPLRVRKLLVHKRELKKIEVKVCQKGLTLIPLRIYFTHGLAKVEVAIARGATHGDKRQTIRERQSDREMKRAIKRYS